MYLLIFNINFYFLIVICLTSTSLLLATLRTKFHLFIACTLLYSFLGFYFNLDGMMLVLLTTEFTVILIFLMTYMQLYAKHDFMVKSTFSMLPVVAVLCLTPIYNFSETFFYYVSYYKLCNHIVSSDFYVIYYLLFEKLPLLVIIVTLAISLFSLFFIILFFNIKLVKNTGNANLKSINFLRKQNLTKQTSFKTRLYTFQN